MAQDILIIDDEADIRNLIAGVLEDEGFETRQAEDGLKGIEHIRERCPSLVILDIWLGDSRYDGIKILEMIKQETPDLPVLMISGHGTVETAVAAIKRGAYDFVEKPFKAERLLILVRRAMEAAALRHEVVELKQRNMEAYEIIGCSHFTAQLRQTVQKVAAANSRILISGPTGGGKEFIARCIHNLSRLDRGRFIVVNCASPDPAQFERDLYGEEKNGERVSTGAYELAHNGTLFLDEVGEIPFTSQSKLVRTLHEQAFARVGGARKVQANVRVIGSTSVDCVKLIERGLLREDLYYRLNVVSIPVLPLCARPDDIPLLANRFLELIAQARSTPVPVLSQEAILALQNYNWPGNIRQLKNVMEWIIIMMESVDAEGVTLDMLPVEISQQASAAVALDKSSEILALPLREARELFEKEYMVAQLAKFSGNISQTASFIGMERSALHRKLRLLSVSAPSLSLSKKTKTTP